MTGRSIPPSKLNASQQLLIEAVNELTGANGKPGDRAVRFSELVAAGLIMTNERGLVRSGAVLEGISTKIGTIEGTLSGFTRGLSGLQSTIEEVGGAIQIQSREFTDLRSRLEFFEGEGDNLRKLMEANSVANQQLVARIAASEDRVEVLSQASTKLLASANVIEGELSSASGIIEATASAQQDLFARVGVNEGTILAHSEFITDLQASVALLPHVYLQPDEPTGGTYLVGDMWLDSNDGNKVHVWDGTVWGESVDLLGATIYAQDEAPAGGQLRVGDLWFDTDNNMRQHRWNGAQWADVTDPRIAANASAVQDLYSKVQLNVDGISAVAGDVTDLKTDVYDGATGLASKASNERVSTAESRIDTIEGTTSSMAQDITALEAKSGGGVGANRVKNPSGELNADHWLGGTLTRGDGGRIGTFLDVAGTGAGTVWVFQPIDSLGPNDFWTWSATVLFVGSSATLYIEFLDANNNVVSSSSHTPVPSGADWARYSVTAQMPPNGVKARAAFQLVNHTVFRFTRAQFEKGQYATPFNNERDLAAQANAIQTLTATTTQHGNDISSISGSVTSLNAALFQSNPNLLPNPTGVRGGADWYLGGAATNLVPGNDVFGAYLGFPDGPDPGQVYIASQLVYQIRSHLAYSISGELWVDALTGGYAYIDMAFYDAADNYLGELGSSGINQPNWHRVVLENITPPAGTTRINMRVVGVGHLSAYWWRRLKLEEGASATPYSEEGQVNAMASAASTLNAQVQQIDGVVSSNAAAITSLKVSSPGSGNLMKNTTFDGSSLAPWTYTHTGGWTMSKDIAGAAWQPPGIHGIGLVNGSTVGANSYGLYDQSVPVAVGSRYCLSVYAATHRGKAALEALFLNSAGQQVVPTVLVDQIDAGTGALPNGGQGSGLGGWPRLFGFVTAPAGAAFLVMRLVGAGNGATNPYIWFVRPMIEEVSADKTTPSRWSAGGTESLSAIESLTVDTATLKAKWNVSLNVNGYASGFESVNNGSYAAFKILSDYFGIVNPSGGAGLTWENGVLWNKGTTTSVILGQNFGAGSDLLLWAGPNPSSPATATKTGAVFYVDKNGVPYFKGTMVTGSLRTSGQNPMLQPNAVYNSGPFGTNGGPIAVNASYSYSKTQRTNSLNGRFTPGAGSTQAAIELWRSIGGAGYTLVGSHTANGSMNIISTGDTSDVVKWHIAGSINYTDNAGGTAQRQYEARLISRSLQTANHNGQGTIQTDSESQAIGITTAED